MARKQHSFSEQLREAIDQDERSRYRISMETGIPQGQLSRFMHNKGGLPLRNALQQPAVLPRTGSQPEMANPGKPADCKALRESAARGEKAVSGSVVPTGFEPVTSRM